MTYYLVMIKRVFVIGCHKFFLEVHKGDGQPYCPRSLSTLLSGIHHYIQANSANDINVQQQEGELKRLHTLLDNLYHQLHQQGIGTTKAQASIITESQEHQLWVSSTFNNETPQEIINTVFSYNGINFVLRGEAEHRKLTVEQLFFGTEESNREIVEFVEYMEFGSKNHPGGTKQLNMDNKPFVITHSVLSKKDAMSICKALHIAITN